MFEQYLIRKQIIFGKCLKTIFDQKAKNIFDHQSLFSHQEVILNLFGLVCKELNQEMFTRWGLH